MRLLSTAICTSVEPVSSSERRCSVMISDYCVLESVIGPDQATRRFGATGPVCAGQRVVRPDQPARVTKKSSNPTSAGCCRDSTRMRTVPPGIGSTGCS